MSSYTTPPETVNKLSQITIDTDKPWDQKGISNLKELALGMTKGDILMFGVGGVLKKLSPGNIGHILTANGTLTEISWQAPSGT